MFFVVVVFNQKHCLLKVLANVSKRFTAAAENSLNHFWKTYILSSILFLKVLTPFCLVCRLI